jgi:Immunoglobulin-like domain of bacterial spore germination
VITDDEVMRLFERADPARLDDSAPVIDAAGYLDTLRTRSIDVTLTKTPPAPTGPSSRHRWRIIAAAAAAVVLIAGAAVVLTARSSPTDETSPTTAPATSLDRVAWPDPNGGELFTDPVEAARSFVTLITGVADPPLSEVQPGSPSGLDAVDVFDRSEQLPGGPNSAERSAGAPRVASTVLLRQVGEHWFVTGARSRDVEITAPTAAQEVTSPVAIAGSGYFEGNVVVQLRARTAGAEVLAEDVAPGGSPLSVEPFTAELSFDATPTRVGFVVAVDEPTSSGAVPVFAASVVVLGP